MNSTLPGIAPLQPTLPGPALGSAPASPLAAQQARRRHSYLLGEWREDLRFEVRAQMRNPYAGVELHDIHYVAPREVDAKPSHGFLDFALNHRAGEPRARFPEVRGHHTRPMGDLIFVPADTRLHSTWSGGLQRSVCVLFERDHRLERVWTACELDTALDLRGSALRGAMRRLAQELEHPGFESALMVETLCIQIAIILRRELDCARDGASGGTDRGRLSPGQLARVEEMLNCNGPVPSLGAIASQCGLSPRHFCRLFRAATGTTLTEFAGARRIERAISLLDEGRMPIKQIAWACGFERPAAFSAAFRRATGRQPSAWRTTREN